MKKFYLSLLSAVLLIHAFAQTEPQYSLYMFTKQALNPGSVGSRGNLTINGDYRTQWVNIEGGPRTFNAGVQVAPNQGVQYGHHAGGLLISHDEIGVSEITTGMVQYAYRIPVSEKTILSFGVQGLLQQFTHNYHKLAVADINDPVQLENANKNLDLNLGAGAYVYADNFFAGLSVPQAVVPATDIRNQPTQIIKRHYFLMGGYLLPVSNDLKLRLNGLMKFAYLDDMDGPLSSDINLSFIFFDRMVFGASYRTDHAVTALAQIQLTRTLNLGYAIDFKTGEFGRYGGLSHEIFIGFDLNSLKGPFTTPRFVSYF